MAVRCTVTTAMAMSNQLSPHALSSSSVMMIANTFRRHVSMVGVRNGGVRGVRVMRDEGLRQPSIRAVVDHRRFVVRTMSGSTTYGRDSISSSSSSSSSSNEDEDNTERIQHHRVSSSNNMKLSHKKTNFDAVGGYDDAVEEHASFEQSIYSSSSQHEVAKKDKVTSAEAVMKELKHDEEVDCNDGNETETEIPIDNRPTTRDLLALALFGPDVTGKMMTPEVLQKELHILSPMLIRKTKPNDTSKFSSPFHQHDQWRPESLSFFKGTGNSFDLLHMINLRVESMPRDTSNIGNDENENHPDIYSGHWLSKKQMEQLVCESISDKVYESLIASLEAGATNKSADENSIKFLNLFRNIGEKKVGSVQLGRERFGWKVGIGKRKTVTAFAYIKRCPDDYVGPKMIINGRSIVDYFEMAHRKVIIHPLAVTGLTNKMIVLMRAFGGGQSGRADACRIAIGRALTMVQPAFIPLLDREGVLHSDKRQKERKKTGWRKARKKEQYSKR